MIQRPTRLALSAAVAAAMVAAMAPSAAASSPSATSASSAASASAKAAASTTINNATGPLDQDGKPVDAHGGGFLDNRSVDGYYWWVGESRTESSTARLSLYKSKNLVKWTYVGVVADPSTTYTAADGTVTHPFANSKAERPKLLRTSDGKYVVWTHWEVNATYSASQTMVLEADQPQGPYKIVTDHFRPGASTGVGANGQAGSTDAAADMGDRIGQLHQDYNTKGTSGSYDGSPLSPVTSNSYPVKLLQYNDPSGPKTDKYDPDQPSYVSAGMYGTSASSTSNWWTYNFNDITSDLTLKAVAVQMTPYDSSAYDAAKAKGLSPSAGSYIARYPAAKSDLTKAAGVSSQGYSGGSAKTAYDPNTSDRTTAVLGAMDKSSTTTEKYTIVNDASGQRQKLTAPVISPTLKENTGVNKSSESVVVKKGDHVYVTSNVDLSKYKVMVTTDGSDPKTSKTAFQWDNRYKVPSVAITDGMTVRAVSTDFKETKFSPETTETFTVAAADSQQAKDVPVFNPVMDFKGGKYTGFGYAELRILEPSYGVDVYYTMDGGSPVPARYGQNVGFGTRDYTVYTDQKKFGGTGETYLVSAQDNVYMRVWKLDSSLTNVVASKEYDLYVTDDREAPALTRGPGGKNLYLITSGQSGWYPNQAKYGRTSKPDAGFSAARDEYGYRSGTSNWTAEQPFGDNTTYASQPLAVLNLGTKNEPKYVYVGDRWNASYLDKSTSVWLPLTIDDNAEGSGAKTGKTVTVGTESDGTTVTAATYKPAPGLVTMKWLQKVKVNATSGIVGNADGGQTISFSTTDTSTSASDHTPRVIAYQPTGSFYTCDKIDPQSSDATWVTCPGGKLEKQGVIRRYDVGEAFNGVDWDVDNYDGTEQLYMGTGNDYYITVDLGQKRQLTSIGLSFKDVGGSDAADRYEIYGSNDNKTWTEIVDNTENNIPGFQSHDLTGKAYRYLKLQNRDNFDISHNKSADWSRGLYEMTVSAKPTTSLNISGLQKAVKEGTQMSKMTDRFTAASLKKLNAQLKPAKKLLTEIQTVGDATSYTQADVNSQTKALNKAINSLQTKKGVKAASASTASASAASASAAEASSASASAPASSPASTAASAQSGAAAGQATGR